MYISSKPSFRLRQLLGKSDVDQTINVFPINSCRCHLFFSGRYALAAGVKALGLADHDHVLMPSYNCGVEIDPIRHAGPGIKYYRVKQNLIADMNDLRSKIDGKTKAILVTHYLGFPQPLDQIGAICKQHGIFLIEDCAHAFLSNDKDKPLGSFGDISIFSFRKTLPIPNGGALVINNEDIRFEYVTFKPNFFSTYYVIAEFLKRQTSEEMSHPIESAFFKLLNETIFWSSFFLRLLLRIGHRIVKDRGLYLAYPSGNLFRKQIAQWGISAVSKEILNSCDYQRIKDMRRRNFDFYLSYFRKDSRVSLPFEDLSDGVCPLFFPIIVEKREFLYTALKTRGIAGHDWWSNFHPDVPWDDFPEAYSLKMNMLGLPIHQDLTLGHLHKVLEEFENSYEES
jgi:dTDP-4-amino-4,6-dideoxygalactose transaminase